jgi:hypothetical protein
LRWPRYPHHPPTLVCIAPVWLALAAPVLALTQGQGLVLIFVVLPIVLAAVLVPLMVWRNSRGPRPVLTSEILASGVRGEAEIVSVRTVGSILDPRPMVRFQLKVKAAPDEPPFDLEVVQSLPRYVIGEFRSGEVVEVRLTPDRTAGAVVWGPQAP